MARYDTYWAKTNDEGGYHLFAHHSLDVAACAVEWLARDPALATRVGGLLGVAANEVGAVVGLAAALHDLGKLHACFQMKNAAVASALDPARRGWPPGTGFDHGQAGFALGRDPITRRFGSQFAALFRAATAHHGELPVKGSPRLPAGWSARDQRLAADADARDAFVTDVAPLFFSDTPPQLTAKPTFAGVAAVAGVIAVADWVGSNVDFFDYVPTPAPLDHYWNDIALPKARHALCAVGLGARAIASDTSFGALFPGYAPRGVQLVTEEMQLDGVIVVEAEMGSGKTEAALSLAARCVASGQCSGVTVLLPTMATSNAMFTRLESFTRHLFSGTSNLALAHGKAMQNDLFRKFVGRARRSESYGEGARETSASVQCATWLANPKQRLFADVAVGTVDQAMLGAMTVRHHFVRLAALMPHVVVIDEVHAYDAYMSQILERLLDLLGAFGTPTVLLSATLPRARRARFAQAYLGEAPTLQSDAYPLVTSASRAGVDERPAPEAVARTVNLDHMETADPVALLLPRLREAIGAGAKVAWVRNTVADAQEACRRLTDEGFKPTLFHARFIQSDRTERERQVLDRFGKERPAGASLLIATQVVEQSLDLDFDWLITDLAPTDLVLQRAGRLHRHPRQRPTGFAQATLTLCLGDGWRERPGEETLGRSTYVYDAATLWISGRVLTARTDVQLPSDLRGLVAETYDEERRRVALAECPAAQQADAKAAEQRQRDEAKANLVCVAPSADPPVAPEAVEDDDELLARTRLGDSQSLWLVRWDGESAWSLSEPERRWSPNDFVAPGPEGFRLLRDLEQDVVSVPAYGSSEWQPERVRGEVGTWETWREAAQRFLDSTHARCTVVPLDHATLRGWLKRGNTRRRATYTAARGFELEDLATQDRSGHGRNSA